MINDTFASKQLMYQVRSTK